MTSSDLERKLVPSSNRALFDAVHEVQPVPPGFPGKPVQPFDLNTMPFDLDRLCEEAEPRLARQLAFDAAVHSLGCSTGFYWSRLATKKRHAERQLPRECLSTLAEAEVHAACALIAAHRRMRGG